MDFKLTIGFIILGAALIGLSQSLFVVDQREQALVLQLGTPIGEPREPGLHLKIPLIQTVEFFDKRVLSVDPEPEQVVIASEEIIRAQEEKTDGEESDNQEQPEEEPMIEEVSAEPIVVDTFARYRIVDALEFRNTLRTITAANRRLETILNDATRSVLGTKTLDQLLSTQRGRIMLDIKNRVNRVTKANGFGIEIVDVRIVRADLTPALRTSTVRRMISELSERATETRAKGEERAKEIRATAEKERTVLLAEAERDAQILRGEGDEEAIKIYAEAFNKDKEFYGFMRSMEAYGNTLANPETQLILSPDSDFFRFFDDRRGQ
ncbi:MAG: protease modulator HflC [Pseudomonadota bacterium]